MSLGLKTISAEEGEQQSRRELGGVLDPEAEVAERLRREVRAWGARTRHLVLSSVKSQLREKMGTLCEGVLGRLLEVGDVLEGSGALLSPAPLRVVELPTGGRILLGAVGNREAEAELGEGAIEQTAPRRISLFVEAARVEALCERHRGVRLSLEEACGLAGVPEAGAHLAALDVRLSEASAEELVDLTAWSDVQGFSAPGAWKAFGGVSTARLLRGRKMGRTVFGWHTRDGGKTLRITGDEASRAAIGLCAEESKPLVVQVTPREGGRVQVESPLRWPWAEYRALRLLEEKSSSESKGSTLDGENWRWLLAHLQRALGVVEERST